MTLPICVMVVWQQKQMICLNIIFQVCGKDITSKKYSFWRDLDSPNVYKSIQCDQALLVHVEAMQISLVISPKITFVFENTKLPVISNNSVLIQIHLSFCQKQITTIYIAYKKSILKPYEEPKINFK